MTSQCHFMTQCQGNCYLRALLVPFLPLSLSSASSYKSSSILSFSVLLLAEVGTNFSPNRSRTAGPPSVTTKSLGITCESSLMAKVWVWMAHILVCAVFLGYSHCQVTTFLIIQETATGISLPFPFSFEFSTSAPLSPVSINLVCVAGKPTEVWFDLFLLSRMLFMFFNDC